MDQLSNLPNLSLAELRKILTDNDVKETSSSKESLMNQVSEVLLTNMMIQDMMETETQTGQTRQPEQTAAPPVKDERTLLRERQDREYQESLVFDYQTDKNGDYLIEQPEQMDKDAILYVDFDELSPRSLRAKRMEYYM